MNKLVFWAGLLSLLPVWSVHAESHSVPMSDYGTGTFYVKVGVRSVGESEFMVDTGSGFVVVDKDFITDLLEHDKARYLRSVNLSLANGERLQASVYHVDSMTIGKACRIREVEVVVLPNGSKCILGLSALSKAAPFTFSTEPPTLTLSNCLAA
jgi:predicted aspartyl protease